MSSQTTQSPVDFAQIVENDTDALVVYDNDFRYLYVNREAERQLQKPREQLLGRVAWEVFPEAIGTDTYKQQIRALRERTTVVYEGKYGPLLLEFEARCQPFGNTEQGGLVLYWHDISERKRAEAEQQKAEAALRRKSEEVLTVFESMTDAFFTLDREWRFTYLNQQAERLLLRQRDGLIGHNIWEEFKEAVASTSYAEYHRAVRDGVTVTFEEFYSPLQSWFEAHAYPSEAGLSVYFRDVTPRHKAEEERDRLQREVEGAALRQRQFLRDMLSGLTEGRLFLCDSAADLPAPLADDSAPVLLERPTIRLLRRQVEAVCTAQGLDEERWQDFETAVGEAAMNAVVHAGGGVGEVRSDSRTHTVQVWVRDTGKGITEEALHRATLEKGYTTAGTLGHGFWMMLKTADRIYLLTGAAGTTVVLEQGRTPPEPIWMQEVRPI